MIKIKGKFIKTKLAIILSTILLVFTLLQNSAFADNTVKIRRKSDIPSNKEWSIKFSKSIDNNTIKKENVRILDSKNKSLPIEVNSNGELVNIIPPLEGYSDGETYTLHINRDIKSKDGKALNNSIQMEFTISKDYTLEELNNIPGIDVVWNEEESKLLIITNDYNCIFTLNDKNAVVNGENVTISNPIYEDNDIIYIPSSTLMKTMGITIINNEVKELINVYSSGTSYIEVGNIKSNLKDEDEIFEEDVIYSGKEEIILSLNDNSFLILGPNSSCKVLKSKWNSNGNKEIEVELLSGTMNVNALNQREGDSLRIKVGSQYVLADNTTFNIEY